MDDSTKGFLRILCSGWIEDEDEIRKERYQRGLKIASAIMQKNTEQLEATLEEIKKEDKK